MNIKNYFFLVIAALIFFSCSKSGGGSGGSTPPTPRRPLIRSSKIDNNTFLATTRGVNTTPVIRLEFSEPLMQTTLASSITLTEIGGGIVAINTSLQNNDSVVIVQPAAALKYITKYNLNISTSLQSASGGSFAASLDLPFITKIDSSDKNPQITDDALLTLVQQRTFKYFWDFAHPVSGMARERNTSGETVTTGGTGFGIMSIPVAISRGFITRAEGLTQIQKIVGFLKNTAPHFHGAFSHWMNGSTGAVVPFAVNDDGADLVETSYLVMGLLTARQYFNGSDPTETALRNDINTIWNGVEWDWFRQGGKKVLYWNWSPTSNWQVNVPVQGWNEALITYVLAASSTTHGIPKAVYDSGYARNGAMINNNAYYGYQLPLGPPLGGPLFFEHYSFMGIKPVSLSDAYANYQTQTVNHTRINLEYCKANPRAFYGYSASTWGLTASDIPGGYSASSPSNDLGVIAPTGAISSMPYTPMESLAALKFYYYKLGDKIWGQYGFTDAFSLHEPWFASSFLAIDQGPQIVMIENYRTGLIWNLFVSCPEVKTGMLSLGFTAPYL
jgi:hypothetical protein